MEYIGNEYNIYNPAVLRRFNCDVVRIRIERYWKSSDTYEASVVYPLQDDGAFLMMSGRAVRSAGKPD